MAQTIHKLYVVLLALLLISPGAFASLEEDKQLRAEVKMLKQQNEDLTKFIEYKLEEEVKKLRAEVEMLKQQIEDLNKFVKPLKEKYIAEQIVNTQRAKAQERMAKDIDRYTREQLREIETLYQVANKNWQTEKAKESLEKLIQEYKKANRTGCAVLYLGQMSEGDEKLNYYKYAIENHSNCYYGDGVQVGAYARFLLAHYYKQINEDEKAAKLVKELKKDYPDAIDHRGNLLRDKYPG